MSCSWTNYTTSPPGCQIAWPKQNSWFQFSLRTLNQLLLIFPISVNGDLFHKYSSQSFESFLILLFSWRLHPINQASPMGSTFFCQNDRNLFLSQTIKSLEAGREVSQSRHQSFFLAAQPSSSNDFCFMAQDGCLVSAPRRRKGQRSACPPFTDTLRNCTPYLCLQC